MDSYNSIAIITGASTGIGRSLSIELARRKFQLILISRNQEKLLNTERKIKDIGGKCLSVIADVSKESSMDEIYSKIINPEKVDLIINNAGIGIFDKIQNIKISDWDTQMNTNLRSSFLMTKMIINDMIKKKSGKIVFINSVAGLKPYLHSSAYVASKYALRGFASSLREELREYNIKVVSVFPGAIDTPFWDNVDVDFSRDEMMKSDDVAESIINSILAKNNVVNEEIVIRRTAGDF